MQKNIFHNNKNISENRDKKKLIQISNTKIKNVVDINILLNRVKIEEKNETKRKIIFYSFIILGLSLLGTLMAFLK